MTKKFQKCWDKFDELYFRELTKGEFKMAPGSVVGFVDSYGKGHNALVIHEFKTSLNITYVDPDPEKADTFGNLMKRETSVPFFEEGMQGFYIKRPRELVALKDERAPEKQPNLPDDEGVDMNTEDQTSLGEDENIDDTGPLQKGVKETLE